jgi:hypothetical protein
LNFDILSWFGEIDYCFQDELSGGTEGCASQLGVSVDENRWPRTLVTVACSCEGRRCRLLGTYHCATLLGSVPVLLQLPGGKTVSTSQVLPVGCHCLERPSKRAHNHAVKYESKRSLWWLHRRRKTRDRFLEIILCFAVSLFLSILNQVVLILYIAWAVKISDFHYSLTKNLVICLPGWFAFQGEILRRKDFGFLWGLIYFLVLFFIMSE